MGNRLPDPRTDEEKRADEQAKRPGEEWGPTTQEGIPQAPAYEQLLRKGEEGEWILPEYLQISDVYDQEALEKIKEQAFMEDVYESPWAKLMVERQLSEQAEAGDVAAKQQLSAQAMSRRQLAMTGGLEGGAALKLATAGQREAMSGRQALMRQGIQQRYDIGLSGEQMRQQSLASIPGMELGLSQYRSGIQAQNVGNIFGEIESQREADMRAYEANMRAWSAKEQAQATRESCFPAGTEVEMFGGGVKVIEAIEIGDKTAHGEVYLVTKYRMEPGDKLWEWRGIKVSKNHAVLENGNWVRVKDAAEAMETDEEGYILYNFACEHHRITINKQLFADYHEHDDYSVSDEKALEVLNEEHK